MVPRRWVVFPPKTPKRSIRKWVDGRLTVEFHADTPSQSGWFEEAVGPIYYQQVQGDFLAETHVRAALVGDPAMPPTRGFNSAGLLVRDPQSAPGNQNWVMWNTGYQGGNNCETGDVVSVGSEGKTTVNSSSVLCLNEGSHVGRLVLCRVGPTIRLIRKLDGDPAWIQLHEYQRDDFPDTVDVGLILNGWDVPPDMTATFDYLRIEPIDSLDPCSEQSLEQSRP